MVAGYKRIVLCEKSKETRSKTIKLFKEKKSKYVAQLKESDIKSTFRNPKDRGYLG